MYGFDPLETPAVETLDALGKFLPDTDRPNEGVFAWRDDGDWIALRYDLTAPLARVAAQYRNTLPLPYRRYAIGPVWRNEKPGVGRFRQFYQCDADTVGTSSMAADAELCILTATVLDAVGIPQPEYRIRINNRKILDGVLQAAGILDPDNPEAGAEMRGTVLRAMDKLDRLGPEGVRLLLGKGRKDASGDFTKGAGLTGVQLDVVMQFLASGVADAGKTLSCLEDLVGGTGSGADGVAELSEMMQLVSAHGAASGCVVDPSVVRGLAYYTGPVIEAELLFTVTDAKGRSQQFGSIAGGGRYDGLVRRFTGQDVPATGISIGIDRLLAALKARQPNLDAAGPVIVTVMDRDQMPEYQLMAAELRAAGIRAEVFLGNARNIGRQMKYADQRNAPVAVIAGSQEREQGVVQLKDLLLGRKLAEGASHEEWKARPSQLAVPRSQLVEQVRRLLTQG